MGTLDEFIERHEVQLGAAGLPRSLFTTLWEKLSSETFDAGSFFSVEQFDSGIRRVVLGSEEPLSAGSNVFLIDHAWSFNAPDARGQLEAVPGLLDRVAAMAGVSTSEESDEEDADENDDNEEADGAEKDAEADAEGAAEASEGDASEEELAPRVAPAGERGAAGATANGSAAAADRVFDAMWRLVCSYRLAGDLEPVYFLMDEFGSGIRHSAQPNLRVAPFLYAGAGGEAPVPFSIAWPVEDIAPGDEVTRDFLPGVAPGPRRRALLACFFEVPREPFVEAYGLFRAAAETLARDGGEAAAAEAAKGAAGSAAARPVTIPAPPRGPAGAWRVYSDVDWVQDHLIRTDFVHTTDPSQADILWCKATLDGRTLAALGAPAEAGMNQFPREECLVFKHLLARTAAACPGSGAWLPETFDMDRHAQAMVGAHFEALAADAGKPPLWIVKPWNLGRSLDTVVTRSLSQVAAACVAGPKICQRYIADPLLVGGRKFDLRFLLLVESFSPVKAALWNDFFVRVANHAYTDTAVSLGDFQTHFTSMRQRGFEEEDMPAELFREKIDREAGQPGAWDGMLASVRVLLRELLAAAAPHIAGGRPFARGRALYGVDVMFTRDLKPKLLEVTFCPGVERPMAADPEFLNKVFGALFNGETEGVTSL